MRELSPFQIDINISNAIWQEEWAKNAIEPAGRHSCNVDTFVSYALCLIIMRFYWQALAILVAYEMI